MPDGSGLDILTKLDAKRYAAPIIAVSGHSEVRDVVEAIKRGAFDYIEKSRARAAILAVADPCAGRSAWDPPLPVFPGASALTPREHEVLAHIVECASNKEAAAKLGISRRTVEIHRAHIMRKLGAENSVDLMRIVFGRTEDAAPAAAAERLRA